MHSTTYLRRSAIGATILLTSVGLTMAHMPQAHAQTQPNCVQVTTANETSNPEEAQKQFAEGVKYYQDAKRNAKDSLLGHVLSKRLVEIACANLNQAITLNPKLAMAYVYRAGASSLLGGTVASMMDDLSKAAELDPNIYAELRRKLEGLVTDLGESSEASAANSKD